MWLVALWFWISIMSQVQIRNRIVKIVLKLCTWIVHDWNSTSLEARKVTKLVLDDEIFNLKTLKFLRIQNHSFLLEIFQNDFEKADSDWFRNFVICICFEVWNSNFPLSFLLGMNIGKISMVVVSWSHKDLPLGWFES